jgi:hypothetical protein
VRPLRLRPARRSLSNRLSILASESNLGAPRFCPDLAVGGIALCEPVLSAPEPDRSANTHSGVMARLLINTIASILVFN